MEDHRFDDVARSLSSGTTRRGVLRLLAAGAAGGLSAVTGAGARSRSRRRQGQAVQAAVLPDWLRRALRRRWTTDLHRHADRRISTAAPAARAARVASAPTASVAQRARRGAQVELAPPAKAHVSAPGPWSAIPMAAGTRATRCRETLNRRRATASTTTATVSLTTASISLLTSTTAAECNQVCQFPNAMPACVNGRCGIGSCHAGYADCDGRVDNGCETNIDRRR